jgi:hypothetical protein
MSNDNNRVLGRMGARKLSQNEVEEVGAGVNATLLSVLRTGTPTSQDFNLDS